MITITMQTMVRLDDGAPVTLEQFLLENDFRAEELVEMTCALVCTGEYATGGGAQARQVLRVCEPDLEPPADERNSDPLYGQRMDSADMGEN